MKKIDLHTHSTSSDGTLSPSALMEHAFRQGLSAIALTDHDNLDGMEEASEAAKALGIELVAGIEFSTIFQDRDIHILGLEVNRTFPPLLAELSRIQEERRERNQRMIDRMAADGIRISWEQMEACFGGRLWTRAHFARYLADHGYVEDMWDAFHTHIGEGCPYYVPREKVSPFRITELIRRAGGIPVLAHPFQYKFEEETLENLVLSLKDAGLAGIEAIYSTHTSRQEQQIRDLADRTGLKISGGSDYHGANKPDIELGIGRGNLRIPYEILEQLRSAVR